MAGQAQDGAATIYRRRRQCHACTTVYSSVERVERIVQRGQPAA
jgi:transcriptional regulator NrdR family protein